MSAGPAGEASVSGATASCHPKFAAPGKGAAGLIFLQLVGGRAWSETAGAPWVAQHPSLSILVVTIGTRFGTSWQSYRHPDPPRFGAPNTGPGRRCPIHAG